MSDPLGQVYSGRDDSGAAAILKDGPVNATNVFLNLQAQERARQGKIAAVKAALAAKPGKPVDIPIPQAAPSDMAYFTKKRNDIVAKMRPLYDGSLDPNKRAELETEINMDKGAMMIEAYKSAKDYENFRTQYEDFRKRPWSFDPNTEADAKEHFNNTPDVRQPFNFKRLNETDYQRAIQAVAVDHGKKGYDVPLPGGKMNHITKNVWDEGNVRKAYDAWKQTKNTAANKAFFDNVEEEAAKAYAGQAGYKWDELSAAQKVNVRNHIDPQEVDRIGYQFFRGVKEAQFASDLNEQMRNAPKGLDINFAANGSGGGTLTTGKYAFTYSKENTPGEKVTNVKIGGEDRGMETTPFNKLGEHVAISRNDAMENKPLFFGPNDVGAIDATTGEAIKLDQTNAIPLGYEVRDGKWYAQYVIPKKPNPFDANKPLQEERYFLYPETASRAKLGNEYGGYTLDKIIKDMGIEPVTPIEEIEGGTIRAGESKAGATYQKKTHKKKQPY